MKKHVKRVFGWRVPNAALRQVARFMPAVRGTGRLPAPARLREVEGRIRGARFTMLRPDRCVVAKELYWGGGRRPKDEDQLALEVFASFATSADVMVDVGAYTGLFTLVGTAVNPLIEAHAFEMVPAVFGMLFDNCVRNDVLHRVTLHHVAVGAPGAVVRLPAGSDGSALPDFFSTDLHFSSGALVRTASLDSLVAGIPGRSSVVMKVDVEGTENEVFRHGQAFLADFRPDIVCEVLHGVAQTPELASLLSPHGYRFYLIREHDLFAADRLDPNPRFRDWLLTARRASELRADGFIVTDN